MVKSIMLQGTTSGAGKTILSAVLCRYFYEKGVRVAPFKAQNLSLNSYVTERGHEIGISQAFQAWASNIEPEYCMNPILLKPRGGGSCQIVLKGRPYRDVHMGAGGRDEMDFLLQAIKECYEKLATKFDVIVCEGSGSPAEINIVNRDIANMKTAALTKSPVLLVGDIDKGGVFAGLYGTYFLLNEKYRKYIKGFVINRFRGEKDILLSGIEYMEEKLEAPCLGIVPYVDLRFPPEDSLDMDRKYSHSLEGEDIKKVWVQNLDIFLRTIKKELDFDKIERIIDEGIE